MIFDLFYDTKIKEPTFKRLILIYRSLPETFAEKQLRRLKTAKKKITSKIKKEAKQRLSKLGLDEIKDDEKKEKNIVSDTVDEIGRKRRASQFQIPDMRNTFQAKEKDDEIYKQPICIQYFSDIAMSDLEITYPAKRFSLKPMDQLYIGFTIILGITYIVSIVCNT